MFAEARRLRTMLGVEGSIDPSQDYLGVIDPASEIVLKPVRAPKAPPTPRTVHSLNGLQASPRA